MAAPTPGTRTKPTGRFLERGYRVIVIISGDEDINFFEKTVKPPGIDFGEPIDTTTQWNDQFRTMVNEALATLTPMTFKAAYDPVVYDSLADMALQDPIDRQRTITVPFPDTSSVCFYGFLQKAEFDDLDPKTEPEATVTICPTNQDPATGDEEGPVYTPPSGT